MQMPNFYKFTTKGIMMLIIRGLVIISSIHFIVQMCRQLAFSCSLNLNRPPVLNRFSSNLVGKTPLVAARKPLLPLEETSL